MAMTSARGEFTSTIISGMPTPGKLLLTAAAGLVVALTLIAVPYARTAAFLLDLAGIDDQRRAWIPFRPAPVSYSDHTVSTRHGTIPVRVYRPTIPAPPVVVAFPGVHGGGIDAPRLTRLCERLSSSGLIVVCAPLPDLRDFRITDRSTDVIEDVTLSLATSGRIVPAGRLTLVGVSFAGGLALIASGRTPLENHLNAVVSIGGHGDLTRTVRYLTTGRLPDGSHRPPHDYALAVVALTMADRLVPSDQVTRFAEAARLFLRASLDGSAGLPAGAALLEKLDARMATMDEPARGLAEAIATRDVATLGAAIAPHVEEFGRSPALSPALSPRTMAPVFLMHGAEDNVIPSSETPLTAADLAAHGNEDVQWLITPLLTHADLVTAAKPDDLWDLVTFWREVRRSVER